MANMIIKAGSAPSTPGSGYSTLYPKTDGKWYFKDDAGNEHGPALVGPASFESSEQTLTSGTDTAVAHGLGRTPALVRLVLRCKTAQFGYSIGDEVAYEAILMTAANRGLQLYANATNVGFVLGADASHQIWNRTGGSVGVTATITLANWKGVLRAW